jgi:Holliday junction DNA helicase RuvA
MIRHLRGIPIAAVSDAIILDVGGVGYEVFVSPRHLPSMIEPATEQSWHIYMVVREDVMQLFGFPTLADRELFEMLVSISGVGPKTALGVMNFGHQAVISAVQQANVAFFSAVPRLGKKMAQKIILELQSKVGEKGSLNFTPLSANLRDIETALVEMGLPAEQVGPLVAELEPETDVSAGIKSILQQIRSKGGYGR